MNTLFIYHGNCFDGFADLGLLPSVHDAASHRGTLPWVPFGGMRARSRLATTNGRREWRRGDAGVPPMQDRVRSAELKDIKPQTQVKSLERSKFTDSCPAFPIDDVAAVTGLSHTFIRNVLGKCDRLSPRQLLLLLDQDAFGETFVPRSTALDYLNIRRRTPPGMTIPTSPQVIHGNAHELMAALPDDSVQCVVTSPPYWGTRIYETSQDVEWADGERCPFGHEQTPEAYVRHTVEILNQLKRILTPDGSIWWNVMDTFNTRTQIRTNAAEALRAMQGRDKTSWADYACRRYSAGHAFLKDGEQCSIPSRICERASRIGLYVKSVVTWIKSSSLPEPQNSRVSRNLEYIVHLTKQRTPYFDKEAYRTTPTELGGRGRNENDRVTDTWVISTSSGQNGHGAQFALALPGRCIVLTTRKGDLVFDPFVGSGTTGAAAVQLERKFLGFDACSQYIETARRQLSGKPIRSGRRKGPLGSRTPGFIFE